jgi:hypothetical protein
MVFVIKIVSKKSLGVKLMFDISIENSTKTIKRLYYYSVAVFTFYFISTKDYPQDKNQFYHSLK